MIAWERLIITWWLAGECEAAILTAQRVRVLLETLTSVHFCSPVLVANLWDVTDRDIDKFAQAVFDRLTLTAAGVEGAGSDGSFGTSVVTAVAQSREVCKLKYLTGAAPVVYGIPFYL